MKNIYYFTCGVFLFLLVSCSNAEESSLSQTSKFNLEELKTMVARGDQDGGDFSLGDNNGHTTSDDLLAEAGTLTAGEWRDLHNWEFWQVLMQKEAFSEYQKYWEMYFNQRYSVQVVDNLGNPVIDCQVELIGKDKTVFWESKTNNYGLAELWSQPYLEKKDAVNSLVITYNNTKHKIAKASTISEGLNKFKLPITADLPENTSEVMFVVDATGSMEDEIAYLKKELADVVHQVKAAQPNLTLKIGSVFYRDVGDEYLTRVAGLSEDVSSTLNFINKQAADGGGDYPEAVDAALIEAISMQNWSSSARSRIVFLMLDAPPHHDIESITVIQNTIKEASQKGIRLIPIASSGIDKDTEFLMRFFSLATNGSYIFMTDHSGIGNGHIEPTVGQYKIEYLNDMLARIILESIAPIAQSVQ